MSSDEAFLELLSKSLAAVGLDALVVGSVAGLLQGAPITTQDVDLLIRDTPLNRKKIGLLANELGAAPPYVISAVSAIVRISGAAVDVDILFDFLKPNLRFSSLKSRADLIKFGSHPLKVASLEDIILAKRSAGRPKDLAQLPMLEQTLAVRSHKKG